MIDLAIQESLLESIKILADERLKNVSFTKSYVGLVKKIDGLTCTVEVLGSESSCLIPDNLKNYITIDDVVIVQDINNNNRQKIVQGVIGASGGGNVTYFHIYDPDENRIVSSVEHLYDEVTGQVLNVMLEIE